MNNIFKRYVCIKQHDSKDCGCACLATVCKQYGLTIPISKIRELASTDKEGTSVYGLINAAESIGFDVKAVKSNDFRKIFSNLPFPAIAHVIINKTIPHYVVIHEVSENEIIVADPNVGIVKYKPDDFFEIWTGIIMLMLPNSRFEQGNQSKGSFKRFLSLLKPQKGLIVNIFLASVLYTAFGIGGSFYYQYLVDNVLQYNIENTLNVISIGFVMLSIFGVLLNTFRTQLLLYLTQRIDVPLMLGYYNHVVKLPMNFFGSRKIGEILSRFNDANNIKEAISEGTLTILIDTIMVLIGGFILYSENHLLFSITLIPVILYIIIVWSFNKPISNINRTTMENSANMTSYLVESLNGIETVKSFNAEREVCIETERRLIRVVKAVFKNGFINNIQTSLKSGIKGVFGIVLLWIGAHEVINGRLTIGQLLSFNALLVYFLTPIENLINLQSKIQTAIVAADRLSEILDIEIEKSRDEDKKIKPESLKGTIEFKNVDFRYGEREHILKDLSLIIRQGEKIALVGESGAGKTTLAKLLMNFYKCNNGELLINGYNIQDINLDVLREKVVYISQNIFLFSGTIKENLYFGKSDINLEKIISACKKAKIHDYINSLPLRYDTLIEENGSNFSGGQKQRLAIARAILKKPDIIIMDEATSSLDSVTEKAIEKTMYEFSKDTTTIIIAHRLSTIMRCDKIYVIDKGTIVEGGAHNELINNRGIYYNLWKDQLPDYYISNEIASTMIDEVIFNE
ncbi:peptidase domain-containing ABC transporter [Clostridium zeae]|uniref:peptidase domain-containing ABC transporter n=1 Tax=Clostridium zeae TaxID=2759022 RepID=UPI001A8EE194|nr:peptidase domain-containing ABC transporter [Clostridium zeae]